jgi:signal transduction histidine kinase
MVAALVFLGLLFSRQPLENERAQRVQELDRLPERPLVEPSPRVGYHSRWSRTESTPLEITLDLGQAFPLDSVVVVPAAPAAIWGYGFPSRFKVETLLPSAAPVVLIDRTDRDHPLPQGPLAIPAHGQPARYIRFTATRLFRQPNWSEGFMFCLGEIYAFSNGRNVALNCTVGTPSSQFTRAFPDWSPENLVDGASALGLPVEKDLQPSESLNSGWHSGTSLNPETPKWVQIDLGQEWPIDEIRAVPASPLTFTNRPGFGFPERYRIELSATADFQVPVLVVDATQRDQANPGNQLVCWSVGGRRGRFVRFTSTKMQCRDADYAFALAELQVFSGGKNVARGCAVQAPDPTPHPSFQPAYLVDGRSGSGRLLDLEGWLGDVARRAELEAQIGALDAQIAALDQSERRFWLVLSGTLLALGIALSGLAVRRAMERRKRELQNLRQQIARDLHDEIGSSLGTISLMSELGEREGDMEALARIRALASEAANSMRGIVWMIRDGTPPPLDQLEKTLSTYCAQTLRSIPYAFRSTGAPPAGSQPLDFYRNLFLFFKEALHNALRHSKASRIEIRLAWRPGQLELGIEDNGIGFDPGALHHGSGLANMRQRASALRATLSIESGAGSSIRLTAPLS